MKSIISFLFMMLSVIITFEISSNETYAWNNSKLPWHMADIHWRNENSIPFESLSIDFYIEGKLPTDAEVFIVPIDAKINNSQFYAGLITNIPDADSKLFNGKNRENLGKGTMFTHWAEESKDSIRLSESGLYWVAHHEGPHSSVRTNLSWDNGFYSLHLMKMNTEITKNKKFTWVGCFLENHATEGNTFLGACRFPGEKLEIKEPASFLEVYSLSKKNMDKKILSNMTVTFGNLKINNEYFKSSVLINHSRTAPVNSMTYSVDFIDDEKLSKSAGPLINSHQGVLVTLNELPISRNHYEYYLKFKNP